VVRTKLAGTAGAAGLSETAEWIIAPSTKTVTVSKDTYAYIDGVTGALSYYVASTGGAAPVIGTDIAANSQMIAKIVCGASNISAIVDRRGFAPTGRVIVMNKLVSFETGEQGLYQFPAHGDFRVLYATGVVVKAIGGTDTGTVTLAITSNGVSTAVTTGVLTFGISAALGVVVAAAPTAANLASTGNYLTATTAKTTAGGKVDLSVVLEELPN
ncbi:MAG: hypothetical protein ACRDYC_07825, partial [Acidimicrobiales bacterium]